MAQANLLDIAKLNGSDAVVGLIEENLNYAPELGVIPARTIRGTSYKISTRTAYPGVGFRNANEGSAATKSTFESKMVECFILSASIVADKAVADAYEDGADAWKAIEAAGVMKQAMLEVGSQTFYGTSVDSKGFPGLQAIHTALGTDLVVDAGGTTDSVASSVYGIKLGNQGVQYVFGSNTTFELGEWREQLYLDGSSNPYDAYVNSLTSWVGMQVGSKYAVGRLKDATTDSGKGVTDARLAELLSKYPVGMKPDIWLMSRRSAYQLQSSRTVTINSGPGATKAGGRIEAVAPLPEEAFGIPIIVTDSITDTETLS